MIIITRYPKLGPGPFLSNLYILYFSIYSRNYGSSFEAKWVHIDVHLPLLVKSFHVVKHAHVIWVFDLASILIFLANYHYCIEIIGDEMYMVTLSTSTSSDSISTYTRLLKNNEQASLTNQTSFSMSPWYIVSFHFLNQLLIIKCYLF